MQKKLQNTTEKRLNKLFSISYSNFFKITINFKDVYFLWTLAIRGIFFGTILNLSNVNLCKFVQYNILSIFPLIFFSSNIEADN